tara:strand:- start:1360 stop:1569 length:210 start_codon:yes stop_codon:yes gene_type:complete
MGVLFSYFKILTKESSLEKPLIYNTAPSQTQMILSGIYDEENPPPPPSPSSSLLYSIRRFPSSLLDAFD